MILPDRITIEKKLIPYQFDIELTGAMYNLRVDYNHSYDFFTVTLSKNGRIVVYNEPIVYGQRLFGGVFTNDGAFPACDIIPLDLSGNVDVVNWKTFCKDVFLWIDNGGGNIADATNE